MTGKITRKFRLHNARQFYEMFSEASPSNLYFFIAKPTAWPNDNSPPGPIDSVLKTDYDIWNDVLALKKISPSNISFGIPKNSWVTGSTFAEYSSKVELDDDFHVVTDEYRVYKCLSNHGGIPSTEKPTGKTATPFRTIDGYVWKYMYTLSTPDAINFLTSAYVPVKTLIADDDSDQWDIQQAAISGGIESFTIEAGGAQYFSVSNTFSTSANATHATITSDAAANNNFYTGSSIFITGGTGSGQIREIIGYDGINKIVQVQPDFDTPPNLSSSYTISPKVTITGDGTGATAYSVVTAGAITSIEPVTSGTGYTRATTTLSSVSGTGAVSVPHVSPISGHGADPVVELFGHNVIMGVEFLQSDANFMNSNDYRIVGIMVDPLKTDETVASGAVYDMTTRLTVSTSTGNFFADEIIVGATSGATGVFIEYREGVAVILNTGDVDFEVGEIITGDVSEFTALVTARALPELIKYTGDLLYYENRKPVTRSEDQRESVKIVVKF